MNKFTKTMIVSLLLIITMPMARLSAQVSTWDGTWEPWTHGTGTEADPFLIENAQQLAYLAYRVNNGLDAGGGHVSNHNYHYQLINDINLNNLEWNPIGYYISDQDYQCFGGCFWGNNHTISGLYINSSSEDLGLMGIVNNGSINDLHVTGEIIATSRGCAGGIVGHTSGTTNIITCSFDGSITSSLIWDSVLDLYSFLGGIVGASENMLIIDNCYNSAIVNSRTQSHYEGGDSFSYAGGIVGFGEGHIIITNSQNLNRINSNAHCPYYEEYLGGACSGGIIGYGDGILNIKNCNNQGEIYSCHAFGKNVYAYAGGIIGYGSAVDSINNCRNIGTIESFGTEGLYGASSYSGGIMGYGSGNTINCYNNGNVFSNISFTMNQPNYCFSGGIVGRGAGYVTDCYNTGNISSSGKHPDICSSGGIMGFAGIISNCYNTGYISAYSENTNTQLFSGGITGSDGIVSNSYFINTCGGDNSNGGTSLSSLEMQTNDFVNLLNAESCQTFVQDIIPNINNGYPLLTMMTNCAYTGFASNLTDISATLNGFISASYINYTKGFEYRKLGESTFTTVNVIDGNSNYSYELNSLEPNNTYEYRAFAYFPDCDYTTYGEIRAFDISWLNQDTIFVNNADMLRWVAEQCNSGATFEGKYIKLMNDIVLPENVPNNMISIGSYPDHPFKGTFDGNGKLIYNLYIDQPNTPYQGFFGYTLNANLYNVGLVNITASGRNYTGGMVAYAENTHMRDCYVNGGTLFALSYCGGLVGYQEQGTNSIISGCYNTCTVSGNHYVGGLVGFSNYGTVRNSYVAAPVSGQGNGIGAIIGGANEVLMYNCYFSTEITGLTEAIGENNFKGGEGLTNAQMRDPQFVNTLNQGLVTPVWMADYTTHINNGFPIIKWQRPGTSVEENIAAKNCISIYPNPAQDFITIQSDDPSVSLQRAEVYDVNGRKVMSEDLDGQNNTFSIAKLQAGVYNIRVQTNNGRFTNLKLVVR